MKCISYSPVLHLKFVCVVFRVCIPIGTRQKCLHVSSDSSTKLFNTRRLRRDVRPHFQHYCNVTVNNPCGAAWYTRNNACAAAARTHAGTHTIISIYSYRINQTNRMPRCMRNKITVQNKHIRTRACSTCFALAIITH